MAEVKGIASVTNNGYRNLSCPLCGYFLKIKIYPSSIKEKKEYKCSRCKSKLYVEVIEEDEVNGDGSIKVNISVTSPVNSKQKIILKKKI